MAVTHKMRLTPFLLGALLLAACGETPTDPEDPSVASVQVIPNTHTLTAIGATQQFQATAKDAGGVTLPGKSFTWASSNPAVAAVNTGGLVTAGAAGPAMITATADGVSGSAAVTVMQTVASVAVTAPQDTLTAFGATVSLTATSRDANGNPIAGKLPVWSSSNAAIATVQPNGTVTAVSNGGVNITATVDGTPGTVTLVVRQVVTGLAVTTQPGGAASGAVLATQPVIELRDNRANVVTIDNSTAVTAAVVTGGGTLSGTVTVTAAGGVVSFTDLGLSGTAGDQTLTFTAAGLAAATSDIVSLMPGAPAQLVITTQPSASAQVGVVFGTQPVVQLNDGSGNAVSLSGIQVAASIDSGGGTLGGTSTRTTSSGGQVTYTDLAITGTLGGRTLTFTSGALTVATTTVINVNTAGMETQLGMAAQPSATATSGAALAQQPAVQLQDAGGNGVNTAGVVITAVLSGGGGTLGGATTATTNASGLATFADLAVNAMLGNRTLSFTSGTLTGTTSANIDVNTVGTEAQLLVMTQPSATATNGASFLQQPAVRLQDAGGNNVSKAGVVITAVIGTGGGALGGTTTATTGTTGVAAFTDLAITGTLGNRTLNFTSGTLTGAPSSAVNVNAAGPEAQLIVSTQPSATAASGVPFVQQPAVQLQDASGNNAGKPGVVITAVIGTGGGTLGGTAMASTNGSGLATFTGLAVTGTLGNRTLNFSSGVLTGATSNAVNVNAAGTETQLNVAVQPSATAASGVPFVQQPAVQLQDASGNSVNKLGVVITAVIDSGGGALGGTATASTSQNGLATFAGLAIIGTLGNRILSFTSGALTAARSNAVDVNAGGMETQLLIVTQPSATATSGVQFSQQPAVQLQDASGNSVSKSGVVITAVIASGTGSLGGTPTAGTNSSGIATFTDLTIVGQGAHTLDFGGTGLAVATSATTTVSAPSPPVVLTDGVPVTGLAAPQGDAAYYVFTVPPAAPQLEIVMSGGTGDADLHVRQGALPTTSVYDCRPFNSGNNETCSFASPATGDWFILVHAFTAYTGVTLTASITAACTLNTPGDADGDRLPDCVETNTGTFVSPLNTGTDPNNPDTDGDVISDGDEVLGTVAGLDLPGLGVSPLVPSILIEYDWFDDGGHTHRPTPTQIAMVTASFAAQGIQIISDYGQGPAPFNRGNLISDADGNVDGLGSEYYAYKAANFDANRNGYFHYNMHPHQYSFGNSSGLAEINGDDLITATLNFYTFDLAVAGTIQHELGHNLNLRHGGNVNTNRKPNYNSIMSYNYQFGGVDNNCTPVSDGVLDYSHGVNPPLNENNLNETLGICGGAPGWDWNQDGDALDVSIMADINREWSPVGAGDGFFEILSDYDDWANLSYQGITDADGAVFAATRELAVCQAPPAALSPGN